MKDLNGNYYVFSCDAQGRQIKEYALEKMGFFKAFDDIVVVDGLVPFYTASVDEPTKLVKKESYVIRHYSVKPPKCPICAEKAERGLIKACDCARVIKLSKKTSPYVRYMCSSSNGGGDYVTALADTSASCYKLISEKMIDKEAIFQLYLQNKVHWIRDYGICQMIEERLGINL
jgi:hypothetical protein